MTQTRLTMRDLQKQIDALKDQLRAQESVLNRNNETLFARMAKTEKHTSMIMEGLGGVLWKTAVGHRRWIVSLSTEHLQAILDGGYAGPNSAMDIVDEIDRRKTDVKFREQDKVCGRMLEDRRARKNRWRNCGLLDRFKLAFWALTSKELE